MAPEDRARQRLDAVLNDHGVKPRIVVETPSAATVCALALAGIGVGTGPDDTEAPAIKALDSVNELLGTYSQGWTLDRMPAVDRAILRLGAYEVLYAADVPEAVAISEWVGLATELSTDESPRFVNGLLSRIAEELRP